MKPLITEGVPASALYAQNDDAAYIGRFPSSTGAKWIDAQRQVQNLTLD